MERFSLEKHEQFAAKSYRYHGKAQNAIFQDPP